MSVVTQFGNKQNLKLGTMDTSIDISIFEANKITAARKAEMLELQRQCFPDVSAEEVEEDFCRPPVVVALAYCLGSLAACAEIFKREIEYNGRAITIGGFSPCAREDLRGKGIGTAVCKAAMSYLREQGCAIAFLSVDTRHDSHPLYEKLGFKMLAKSFIYANIHGELKESDGGMIAPLCAPKLFEDILQADEPLTLTPEVGYW